MSLATYVPMIGLFIDYVKYEKRLSVHTAKAYDTDLQQFQAYLQEHHSHIHPEQAESQVLREWIMSLANQGLSNLSINRKLASLKAFYKFLSYKAAIAIDPTEKLKSLRIKRKLPVFVRELELTQLLDEHAFADTFEGWRDKLVLELLYGTGIRLSELLGLQDHQINGHENTIKVLGKRNKERIIPYPRYLNPIIQQYQVHRNSLTTHPHGLLLVTKAGLPAYPMLVYNLVKKYLGTYTQADRHSPHVLRHTFATHLLNHGADLNAIKELLGHASLAATQLYTHNSLEKLKETFNQAHPRA
jgi:integrase/recombinase XerC